MAIATEASTVEPQRHGEAANAAPTNFDPRHFNKPARKYMKQVCLDRYEQFWCAGQASKIQQQSTNYFAGLYSKGEI